MRRPGAAHHPLAALPPQPGEHDVPQADHRVVVTHRAAPYPNSRLPMSSGPSKGRPKTEIVPELSGYSYVQACFVWSCLGHLWNKVLLQCDHTFGIALDECHRHRDRAVYGFSQNPVTGENSRAVQHLVRPEVWEVLVGVERAAGRWSAD